MFLSIYDTSESGINILISNRLFTILFINILCFCINPNRFFTKRQHKNTFCATYTDSDSACNARNIYLFKSKAKN